MEKYLGNGILMRHWIRFSDVGTDLEGELEWAVESILQK